MSRHGGPDLSFHRMTAPNTRAQWPHQTQPRRRNPSAKLSTEAIRAILLNPDAKTVSEWAEENRCDERTIRRLINGESWTHIEPELARRSPPQRSRLTSDEVERIRSLARRRVPPTIISIVTGKILSTVWRVIHRKTHRENL